MKAAGGSEPSLGWLAERWRTHLWLSGEPSTLQWLVVARAVDLERASRRLGLLRVRGGQLPDPGEIDRDADALGTISDHPILVIQE